MVKRATAPTASDETKARIIDAALETVREEGIVGTSARAIARRGNFNQALIFYHFGGMESLLAETCRRSTERRVEVYRQRFATVSSLRQLLDVGREIHTTEKSEGNVAVLAQLLAAGQADPGLGKVTAEGLALWVVEIEAVLARLLPGSPLGDVADPASLARAVAAAFVGLELYEGVDPAAGTSALDALDQLGALLEVVEELGPLARRALRSYVRRSIG